MHTNRPETLEDNLDELREVEKRAAKIAEKITPFDFDKFKRKFNRKDDFKTLSSVSIQS
jgi:hypothetical protein